MKKKFSAGNSMYLYCEVIKDHNRALARREKILHTYVQTTMAIYEFQEKFDSLFLTNSHRLMDLRRLRFDIADFGAYKPTLIESLIDRITGRRVAMERERNYITDHHALLAKHFWQRDAAMRNLINDVHQWVKTLGYLEKEFKKLEFEIEVFVNQLENVIPKKMNEIAEKGEPFYVRSDAEGMEAKKLALVHRTWRFWTDKWGVLNHLNSHRFIASHTPEGWEPPRRLRDLVR